MRFGGIAAFGDSISRCVFRKATMEEIYLACLRTLARSPGQQQTTPFGFYLAQFILQTF